MIVISDFILLLLSGFWRNSSVFGNDETMQEINTLLIALDKTWDDDLLPLCSQIFRRDIRASSELTQAEAVKALGFLKQKATEQKVAA